MSAGQAVVLYDGDRVLGSATIEKAVSGRCSGTGRPGGNRHRCRARCPALDPLEACRLVFGELPDLPHLPELPARGPGADMIGRTAGLLVDLAVDLQPSGWRLVPQPRRSTSAARSDFLARDLDALQEVADGSPASLKVQAAGPWTLASESSSCRAGTRRSPTLARCATWPRR